MKKIIRALTLFTDSPTLENEAYLLSLKKSLLQHNYEIQTLRICTNNLDVIHSRPQWQEDIHLSVGSLTFTEIQNYFEDLLKQKNLAFHLDLTQQNLSLQHVEVLKSMTKLAPHKHFEFSYVFNNPSSSPYFPSARYEKNGFAIGLQPTDLAETCSDLSGWFENMKTVWRELTLLFANDQDSFLGIDSSVAPLFEKHSSFLWQIQRLTNLTLEKLCLSSVITEITQFLKKQNPNPVGLCGLMLPCLEDFELAKAYEKGEFSIERNLFLSLHSGLGIDTYPLAADENENEILRVLSLVQSLSQKYKKPLSVRFISDGFTKKGQKTNFKNQYLKDVIIRSLDNQL